MVYELLEIDAVMRALVENGTPMLHLERELFRTRSSLWQCGLRLVARGVTSLAALREAVREPR